MLASDVQRDLRASARAFGGLVWPAIREHCGGGELVAIETADGYRPLAFEKLDTLAGIDYIQVEPDGVLTGIAARVQPVDGAPWDTFTIREFRDSGRTTELEKRMAAYNRLHHEPMFPHWTVQAYVTAGPTPQLLSAGVILTKQLFGHIGRTREGEGWRRRRTQNAGFLYVDWGALPPFYPVFIVRAGRVEAGS